MGYRKGLTTTTVAVALLGILGLSTGARAQSPQLKERVAALKKSLAESQASLKRYEWVETTAVSLKGDEKSRKQNRCYYAADGTVQKVPVGAAPEQQKKPGLRGKIIENKKEELTEYMQGAVGLVKQYVPPTPEDIQRSVNAGKASIEILEPGKRVRLNFRDYKKIGDVLSVEVDVVGNRVMGLKVSTYLETPKDAVTLDVGFATLPDSTSYPAQVKLNAKEKSVDVNVTNTGHRKVGG
jgi:hypothetical protein